MLLLEDVCMDDIQDHFLCDNCENKDFKVIYNFSLRFHRVNFSEDLVYDNLVDEIYECIKCKKTFARKQIEERLTEFRGKRKTA
jgi:hypothetical protein